jgi:hypothetical protein
MTKRKIHYVFDEPIGCSSRSTWLNHKKIHTFHFTTDVERVTCLTCRRMMEKEAKP